MSAGHQGMSTNIHIDYAEDSCILQINVSYFPVLQTGQSAPHQKGNPGSRPPSRPASQPPSRSKAPSGVSSDNLIQCRVCGRRFAPDRIEIHENICAKTGQKKRKVFDSTKQRISGTGAEPYVKKMSRAGSVTHIRKTNWRQKHEDFINAIRAAKGVQMHLAKGGKLSDLPPPPPSDYSDYIQCPHCGRRFNQQAAERHIPKCATYEFNKPKPKPHGKAPAGTSGGAAGTPKKPPVKRSPKPK